MKKLSRKYFNKFIYKILALLDVAPCSLTEDADVSEELTASIIRDIMEAVRSSETSVSINITTQRNSP